MKIKSSEEAAKFIKQLKTDTRLMVERSGVVDCWEVVQKFSWYMIVVLLTIGENGEYKYTTNLRAITAGDLSGAEILNIWNN